METKNKSEIEVVNSMVNEALKKHDDNQSRINSIINRIKINQSKFYNWQLLEKHINCGQVKTDEDIINFLHTKLGNGIVIELIKAFIPTIKRDLKAKIDKDIESLNL